MLFTLGAVLCFTASGKNSRLAQLNQRENYEDWVMGEVELRTISNRLRAQYPVGPLDENGQPEFGWRDMSGNYNGPIPSPLMIEAAEIIDQIRQQLEAAEAEKREFQNLYLLLNPSAVELPDAGTFEINLKIALDERDEFEKAIRETLEQDPFIYRKEPHKGWPEYSKINEFSDGFGGGMALYKNPVPAMPIQDDKWVTITNEEWNIPKLGQRVIVCIDGVVQNVPVKLDMTDPDVGCGKYYWDHKDFDESPFVKAGDSWMPWPSKPQSEVKPS